MFDPSITVVSEPDSLEQPSPYRYVPTKTTDGVAWLGQTVDPRPYDWPYPDWPGNVTYVAPEPSGPKPHKCPVCEGTGKSWGECHACNGSGIVWSP